MQIKAHFSDMFWCIVIGLAVVLGGILLAIYVPEGNVSRLFRWIGLAGATAVTFGYLLRWYSRCLNSAKFWGLWLCFLTLHLAAYVFYLRHAEQWPLILFALITPIEWSIFCRILDRAVRGSAKQGRY